MPQMRPRRRRDDKWSSVERNGLNQAVKLLYQVIPNGRANAKCRPGPKPDVSKSQNEKRRIAELGN